MWGGGGTEGEGEKASNSVVVFSRAVGKEDMGFRRPPLHWRPAGREDMNIYTAVPSVSLMQADTQPLATVTVASRLTAAAVLTYPMKSSVVREHQWVQWLPDRLRHE